MSSHAMLPCLVCGKPLERVLPDEESQPYGGTVFATYGHYGSTFWDSFDGEELVITVCDDCLREHTNRLGQHKRFRPVNADGVGMVGKQWVDRPVVPYSGNPDDGDVRIEPEEIGSDSLPEVEWNYRGTELQELREYAINKANGVSA